MTMTAEERYMEQALALAQEAAAAGEVPVGCVIVRGGEIVGRGRNRREEEQNALLHAEVAAIAEACRTLHSWRLSDCDLYVTLEPCPMCAGAIVQARVGRLVYGAANPEQGCAGSLYRVTEDPAFPHFCPADGGVLAGDCQELLEGFFRRRREKA